MPRTWRRISAPITPSSMSSRSTRSTSSRKLAEWYDEPFADSSQIPTYLVSELTRRHVTVALSGDGGDELFAGYNRYLWAGRLARAANAMPRGLHRPIAAAMRALSPEAWNRLLGYLPLSRRCVAARRQAAQARDACRRPVARRDLSPAGQPVGAAGRDRRARQRAARPAVGCERRARLPGFRRAHAVPRPRHLSAGRHSHQGRPRHHGGRAGGQGAADRPPRGRLCLEPAAAIQAARRAGQVAACARCSTATCRGI